MYEVGNKARITRLQRDFEKERKELQEKAHKEQVALKDQLQVHIQTIGILVAEKTELQSSLTQSQQSAKQKAAEVEEFQGRLRGSRQRVADLERELGTISSSSQQMEKNNKELSKEVDRLKMEVYKLGKVNDEQKLQISELTEKFNKKVKESHITEQELTETRSKLSISELYVQQLSNSNTEEGSRQLEDLHQEKLELEKKLSENKESLQKLSVERDQMSEQYQTYIQQLSQQVTSLKDELKEYINEREKHFKERAELQEEINRLQQKESAIIENGVNKNLQKQIEELESIQQKMKQDYDTQVNDNAQMSKIIEEKEIRIEELENSLRRIEENQIDKEKLLDTMQSDKIAASRAVAQNCELKKQLEELHTGFVKMVCAIIENGVNKNLQKQIEELESIQQKMKQDYDTQVNDNAQMSKIIEEKEIRIEELENSLRRIEENQIDKEKLLDTMQSDKIAASRAVAQNCELKKQLEELHTGFVKMSHDKLELTEKLDREHHITKELGERLSQQEEELQELKDQVNINKNSVTIIFLIFKFKILYFKERINALMNQNTELRMNLARQAEIAVSSDKLDERDSSKRNDLVASLSASVRQLEMERDQLLHQLEEQQNIKTNLKAQMREIKDHQINQGTNNENISMEDYQHMKNAMKQLEERFKKTMDQIAELSDQKQQLEHLVTQLQGETDTIGIIANSVSNCSPVLNSLFIALCSCRIVDLLDASRYAFSLSAKVISFGSMTLCDSCTYLSSLPSLDSEIEGSPKRLLECAVTLELLIFVFTSEAKLGDLQNLVMRMLDERKQLKPYGPSVLTGSNHFPGKIISATGENGNILNGEDSNTEMKSSNTVENMQVPNNATNPSKTEDTTAKKIMELLTEIGTSNLIEKSVTDNFHPCPLCSGRLMTV
ncbi:golgin subfamily A member 2-like [Centruroides sculpturatus]|uniref:golgin subfamily A member 2-like n=1 Tax=Centruroides sculpturatus TaxID=218467 RepID=UPI000C6E2CC2|nr:golgin subfamily A member 2-like [Centruroides sculpturatus]